MADWRFMGSAQRRRMGAPSHHAGGARTPFVNDDRGAGRPPEPDPSFWDKARAEEGASQLKAGESQWAREGSPNHPSVKQRRMKPESRYVN